MASLLIANIKQLAGIRADMKPLRGKQLSELPSIKNAYLLIEGEEIAAFGPMSELKKWPDNVFDASEKIVLPGWCDSHTHLV
ncbi:MAG: imidazolonepropionase, partial [Chitinophagaceae bacterium]|nr:imidazolonepropionase [Chitinophagaceae bacterium]